MSSLPPIFVDGTTLPAAPLNQMRDARNGDLTPIDPGTNNELDDAYNIGTPTVRWKDGNFSGDISAAGQFRAEVELTVGFFTTTAAIPPSKLQWGLENEDIGDLVDLGVNADRITAKKSGTWIVQPLLDITELVTAEARIERYNSGGVLQAEYRTEETPTTSLTIFLEKDDYIVISANAIDNGSTVDRIRVAAGSKLLMFKIS